MASILGDYANLRVNQSRNLPVSGQIRPGTKVMTNAAKGNPFAVQMFEDAQAGLQSFKEAEKKILDKTQIKNPFRPTNTPYFNVYPHDVEGGKNTVDRIMEMYGEVRPGDTEKRLYSFPMIFPDLPNGVEGFLPSEYRMDVGVVKYHSAYTPDGVRQCFNLPEVDKEAQAKRKKFIRRKAVARGECVPEVCPEFGRGLCTFNTKVHFYIPGVTGSGTFMVRTASTYAAEDLFVRLEQLSRICNGVLPKFDNHGRPVFFMSKMKKQRTYFDENGTQKTGEQWVIVLETTIEMPKVIYLEERKKLMLAAPMAAPIGTSAPGNWLANSTPETSASPSLSSSADEDGVISEEGDFGDDDPQAFATDADVQSLPQAAAPKIEVLEADPLMVLMNLSDDNKMGTTVVDWALAKFGVGWDSTGRVEPILEELKTTIATMGVDCARVYLPLLSALYVNKIPVKELAFPYLKGKFGSFKNKAAVAGAFEHIVELLKSGPAVAIAHMESQSKKAA